jgi:putative ABC transport system permease protein
VEALFLHESPLDKKLTVNGRPFRVLGTMEKFRDAPFGGENPQDSLIFIPYYAFRTLFPTAREHIIAARAQPGRLAQSVEQIEEVLRRRRRVAWDKDNDFEIGTSDSIIKTFDKIVFAALAVMFSLSTVAFLVGGVGVMNVMLASVKERTREIGVRRAIGARRRDITWQFLIEAGAMTGVGGILGVVVGEAAMRGLAACLPALPCVTPMWARLFGFFGSVAVGLIFGLWPAVAAARLDPIKALRYE